MPFSPQLNPASAPMCGKDVVGAKRASARSGIEGKVKKVKGSKKVARSAGTQEELAVELPVPKEASPLRRTKKGKKAARSVVPAVVEVQEAPLDKKSRNLAKQLRLVTILEEKVAKGLLTPSAEQLAKLGRRAALEAELKAARADTAAKPASATTAALAAPAAAVAAAPAAPMPGLDDSKAAWSAYVRQADAAAAAAATASSAEKRSAKTRGAVAVSEAKIAEEEASSAPKVVEGATAAPKKKLLKKRKASSSEAPEEEPQATKKQKGADGSAVVVPEGLGACAYRKSHEIVVHGGRCPAPFECFEAAEVEIGAPLVGALRLQGYTTPTPIQAQAWPLALRGDDMIAVAKTGSGKTCGFLLPVLARMFQRGGGTATKDAKRGGPATPSVLVLAPTRELAQQIAGEADKFADVAGARICSLYGGVPKQDQLRRLGGGADVVIATPGRLLDFCMGDSKRNIAPVVSLKAVTYLVLDEADRMLDMGFEPDIRKIVAECPPTGKPEEGGGAPTGPAAATKRQTLFFTATWPRDVQRTAASFTSQGAIQIRIGQGAGGDKLTANSSVTQVVQVVEEKQKLTKLKEILEKELGPGETCFVFAKTKHTCDYLEQKLWDEKEDLSIGTWCRAIHSHKEQWERDASLATFRTLTSGQDNGRRGILVATDVAARGLDIPGVALVVVFDFGGGNLGKDSGVESYVHRIGRTGRAGKTGKAFTFYTEHDEGAFKLVQLLEGAKQRVPYELRSLAERRGGGSGGKSGGKSSGKGGGKGGKGGSKGGWGGKSSNRWW